MQQMAGQESNGLFEGSVDVSNDGHLQVQYGGGGEDGIDKQPVLQLQCF